MQPVLHPFHSISALSFVEPVGRLVDPRFDLESNLVKGGEGLMDGESFEAMDRYVDAWFRSMSLRPSLPTRFGLAAPGFIPRTKKGFLQRRVGCVGMLKYRGSRDLRARLVMSTISRRALRIDEIRSKDEDPGVRDFEASLLRLLEKISNGCKVEINETGTSLYYKPGIIVGGVIKHDCGTSRSINYYVEALVVLGLFGKKPLRAILKGVTNDNLDMDYDSWKSCGMPILRRMSGEGDFDVKLVKRGSRPRGGGEIHLTVPVVKELPPAEIIDEGLVKRIRGIAWSAKVSPTLLSRAIDSCRGVLNKLLPDVYVFTDHRAGADAGNSPGYGMSLVAETTTECVLSADLAAETDGEGVDKHVALPEDLGEKAAMLLVEEINRGGCIDSSFQSLALLLAALGPEESCRLRIGPLTDASIETLRLIRDFIGVTFNLKPDVATGTVLASCIGSGMKNMARKVT